MEEVNEMEKEIWSRFDGMMIAKSVDPNELATYLAEKAILAQLEWYDTTAHLVGISVVSDGQRVGLLANDDLQITAGPKLIDFVESLAERYQAEVMLGELGIDRLPQDDEEFIEGAETTPEPSAPMRVVEIGNTPASAVPLLAAFEGLDIADLELDNDKRVLMAQLPTERAGWYFGDVPLVTLTANGDEFQAFLVQDDDPENVVTYNWGMNELTVTGSLTNNKDALYFAHEMVGSRSDIEQIHDAVPGIDPEMAFSATQERGPVAIAKFVAALGLPSDVTEFLIGIRALDEIDGSQFHQARGISNALGRSVDIMLDERESNSGLWESYSTMVTERPWQVPLISAVEVGLGATLIVLSRSKTHRRSWLKRLGTLAGVGLLIDSAAELSLAKYVTLRAQRRAERQR